MQPFLRSATSALRQAGAAASSSSSTSRIPATATARCGYATPSGQPMPPAPPAGSGKKSGKKSSNPAGATAASTAGSSVPTSGTEHPQDPLSSSAAAAAGASIDPQIPSTPPLPPSDPASSSSSSPAASTTPSPTPVPSTEIKPVFSLASQYLDATEIPAERTGARSTAGKRPLSSIEKKRRNLGRAALAITAIGSGVAAWNLGREWDSEKEQARLGKEVTDEAGLNGRWQRGQARFLDNLDYFNKPAWEPLIPDPLPPPHQKPYTLILSLDNLLIHSAWTREHGWRTAKRPGVDYFLAYLSQFYEIVLFTSQPSYTAAPIVEKLDPYGIYILYKLFRDCTRYSKESKDVIKDLSYLGRDLSKVILLDTVPEHFSSQPENGYAMPPWDGKRSDTDLVGLIPFLEAIAIYQVQDVRPILKNYKGKHIPTAWAEVEAAQKKQALEEWEKGQGSRKGKLGGGFGSLFGVNNPQVRHDSGPPKTQLEQGREFYQKTYLEEQKWWAEHKDEIEKNMEEDRERQKREVQSSLFTFLNASIGLPPPPKAGDAISATQDGAGQPTSKTLEAK